MTGSKRRRNFITLSLIIVLSLLLLYAVNMNTVEIVIYKIDNRNFSISFGKCVCKVNNSVTPIRISSYMPSWDDLHNIQWFNTIKDGFWSPTKCISNQSLAIIIPYRNREAHLIKLLSHLHPFLQNQFVEYQIIVVEQSERGIFNKGAIINVGIMEAMEMEGRQFTCYIIHDVDMLPIMENNIYQCLNYPLHLGAAVDKYNYNLLYSQIVCGVLALTGEQLIKVNGFSNIYEGWGAEDDDMTERIRQEELKIIRYPLEVGKYNMIKHRHDEGNPSNNDRLYFLGRAALRYKVDGLNSILYSKLEVIPPKSHLVHWITVDIPPKAYFMKPDF